MSVFGVNQIRAEFINFFKKYAHHHIPSASLIPFNDPSLMFVNSGMVPFKRFFTGVEHSTYNQIVTSQKCVRAGGKHNDLENVGYTTRHHTFFEMLGNFCFGNYFKAEAIKFAWELLTQELQLNPQRLLVTVHSEDSESAKLWRSIAGLSEDKIINISSSDNFWSMGPTGPCGPCTEIFYDHGKHLPGGLPGTPNEGGERYVEIWNVVFMQYEQIDTNTRITLPQQCVDTGMGMERIATVLQGVYDNYDIDLFKNLINNIEHYTCTKSTGDAKFSHRIIADHLRASAFLIADGVMPSNEGRGYVLRRIMRRAMRHTHQLGCKEPIIYKLVPCLINEMGDAYPELRARELLISTLLKNEEEKFKITLSKGLKLLDEVSLQLTPSNNIFPGEAAFNLYDTYGFPLDLTEDILKKKGIAVDKDKFYHNMQQQQERAKKAWSGNIDNKDKIVVWEQLKDKVHPTEFIGYDSHQAEAIVIALIHNDKSVESISYKTSNNDDEFWLITNQTPFYAQAGGQMGDIGIISNNYCTINVTNTIKFFGKVYIHVCKIIKGKVSTNDVVDLAINQDYRKQLQAHHSATHILHAVLKEILGNHVMQKGSLVAANYLRFDISHSTAISKDLIVKIEDRVNEIITNNTELIATIMHYDQAISIGATALFEEKYEEEVRVISIPAVTKDMYSIELCGGTHVQRTGDIGVFKIISEKAIAAGIRRIEAIVGKAALMQMQNDEQLINSILDRFNTSKHNVVDRIDDILTENNNLKKQLTQLKINQLAFNEHEVQTTAQTTGKVRFMYKNVTDYDISIIRQTVNKVISNIVDLVTVMINNENNCATILIGVSSNITDIIQASKLAMEIAHYIDGKGGGNNIIAQVGTNKVEKLTGLQSKIYKIIANKVSQNSTI